MIEAPTALEFLRHVSRGQPVLMTSTATDPAQSPPRLLSTVLTNACLLSSPTPASCPLQRQRPPPVLSNVNARLLSSLITLAEAAAHWKALTRWTDAYLTERLAGREVTVAVTPTGYADAVHDGYFVRPHEERKSFGAFLHDLHNGPEVHYVQLQNSNLTLESEFAPVLDDVDREFRFATEALGTCAGRFKRTRTRAGHPGAPLAQPSRLVRA